jgi:hypothetical protein
VFNQVFTQYAAQYLLRCGQTIWQLNALVLDDVLKTSRQ